jgi:hypothetical protein
MTRPSDTILLAMRQRLKAFNWRSNRRRRTAMQPPGLVTRAALYREQAAELRRLAVRETDGSSIKDKLLDLAVEYEKLATQTENSRYP